MLRAKKEAMGLKLTHAFDRLNDVVFSVRPGLPNPNPNPTA